MRSHGLLALAAAGALLLAACSDPPPETGVSVVGDVPEVTTTTAGETTTTAEGGDPAVDPDGELGLTASVAEESIAGNVVVLEVAVSGVEIVAADGDDSGDTGHLHVFIDEEPVAVGEPIPPASEGVIHTTETEITIPGLTVGEHVMTVVVGDGNHVRIHEDLEAIVTVDVKGPAVTFAEDQETEFDAADDVTLAVDVDGIDVVAADGDDSGDTGHLHFFVDVDPVAPGEAIPVGEEGIIHTTETELDLAEALSETGVELDEGQHTVYVVVGDGNHVALDPPVWDVITIQVG